MPKMALADDVKARLAKQMCRQVNEPARAAPVYRGVLDQAFLAMRAMNPWDRMAIAAAILGDETPPRRPGQ
jgi:hypothetical protein